MTNKHEAYDSASPERSWGYKLLHWHELPKGYRCEAFEFCKENCSECLFDVLNDNNNTDESVWTESVTSD